MPKRSTVLFDLDGTLTPPRGAMPGEIRTALSQLQKHAYIGILTGSPYNYVLEQTEILWDIGIDPYNIEILACNGTKRYLWDGKKYTLNKENDMIVEITKERFEELIRCLLSIQNTAAHFYKFPLTGNFISYRGSMVNYCPIGRDAPNSYRKEFEDLDKQHGIRDDIMNSLQGRLKDNGLDKILTYALGGSTSVDIYPNGWDKTFALKHFTGSKNIYFVGDKCKPGGNDYHVYADARTIGFETDGPDHTCEIIKQIINLEK